MNFKNLEKKAKELRKRVIELGINKGEGHLGGSLSEIEILISLYLGVLKEEDKFILSKGHCCYPLYLLLEEQGFNPKISAHPDIDIENGINCTSGSLGHGLPIAVGMALSRKYKNKKGKIYVLIGDGECQEGTTWESSLIASHFKLNNLVCLVDYNKLQALDRLENVIDLGDLAKKFDSFGWDVSNIDGHSFKEIFQTLKKQHQYKPNLVIANTIKGKGVSYMEGDPKWHTRIPNNEEIKKIYEELK